MKHKEKELFNPEKSPKTMAYVIERDTFSIRCNRCGCPVLKSDTAGYVYQCMNCDEDLYSIETHEGNFHTDDELNQLLLDTEALLELDNEIHKGEEITPTETKLDLLRYLQNSYAASLGGLMELKEADDKWNGYNVEIIKAFAKLYPDCVLGKFIESKMTPYTGQKIYNFACDFIIPAEDEELRQLLKNRNDKGYTDLSSLMKIQTRIKTTGGIVFIWK